MDIVRIIEVTVSLFFDKRVKKLKDRYLKEEINRIVRDMQSGLNPEVILRTNHILQNTSSHIFTRIEEGLTIIGD